MWNFSFQFPPHWTPVSGDTEISLTATTDRGQDNARTNPFLGNSLDLQQVPLSIYINCLSFTLTHFQEKWRRRIVLS